MTFVALMPIDHHLAIEIGASTGNTFAKWKMTRKNNKNSNSKKKHIIIAIMLGNCDKIAVDLYNVPIEFSNCDEKKTENHAKTIHRPGT